MLFISEVPLDSITLDTERGLGTEDEEDPVDPSSAQIINTANTRVILTNTNQHSISSRVNLSHYGNGNTEEPFQASCSTTSTYVTVTNVSNVTTFSSLTSNNSTAPIVTISQGSISLPVLGVSQILQGSSSSQEPFSSSQSQFSSQESLPSLMSPRDSGTVLLSPPMTRDQMMSSTIMPRDQMLSSHINPINPKLINVPGRKDQIMSSSRGKKNTLVDILMFKYVILYFRPTVVSHDVTCRRNNLISFTNF